ncbi:MAG: hypothetical protein FDX30_09675 [Chlorobium sp.]|nr:MAG: hypothetical protein FDX30_09675 [Chlorobium sp.]
MYCLIKLFPFFPSLSAGLLRFKALESLFRAFSCSAALTVSVLMLPSVVHAQSVSIADYLPDYSSDYGPVVGCGVSLREDGSESEPYRYRMSMSGAIAPFVDFRYRLQFRGDFRNLFPNAALFLEAGTSGIDRMNFYGMGNERYYRGTGLTEDDFEITSQVTVLKASLRYPMNMAYYWFAGVGGKWVDLHLIQGSYPDLHRSEIPGIDENFAGSFHIGFHYDTRDNRYNSAASPHTENGRAGSGEPSGDSSAVSGTLVDIEAAHFPRFFSNSCDFTRFSGEVRKYIPFSPSGYSRLVVRAGGEKIWGTYPFWEAASLGGSSSLRGYDLQRFAGDASLYAGSELRLEAGKFTFIVPVTFGPLAFLETGRVFLEGEDSSAWHTAAGGGLWFRLDNPRFTASIAYGTGFDDGRLMDDLGIYLKAGFSF